MDEKLSGYGWHSIANTMMVQINSNLVIAVSFGL